MGRAPRVARLGLCVVLGLSAAVSDAAAQPPEPARVPFGDEAPSYDATGDRIRVAAWGMPPRHPARLSQLAAAARRSAEARARRAVHAFIDLTLVGQALTPDAVSALHALADTNLRVVAFRPLADGTAVVRMELAGEALRRGPALVGVPWVR